MNSDFMGPVNIGSEEMVTINDLAVIAAVAHIRLNDWRGDTVDIKHIDGPLGVRGRNSDNKLIREKLDWDYQQPLWEGITKTYAWISEQMSANGS
jgi:nucleoside-diphosphate-sugar epimerase